LFSGLEQFPELFKSEGGHISSIKILQPEKKESLWRLTFSG